MGPYPCIQIAALNITELMASPRSVVTIATVVIFLSLVVPTSVGVSFGAFGDLVKAADKDYAQLLVAPSTLTGGFDTPFLCARTNTAIGGLTDDYFYLRWAGSCAAGVSTGDIRITTTTPGGSAGTVVGDGSADRGLAYDTPVGAFLAGVSYLETDGKPGYTVEDAVYYSADATLDVVNADLRLATISAGGVSNTAGTIVTVTSATDRTEAADNDGNYPDSTALLAQGTFLLRVVDNGDGIFNPESDKILLTTATPTATPSIGYIQFNAVGGQTFGQKIKSTTTDYDVRLIDQGAVTIVETNAVTNPVADRHLFLHFADNDATNDHIQVGDILIKSGSQTIGTRVSSNTNGAGEVITVSASFVAHVFWIDVDGNNHFTPATDPVYWNRPATGFGGAADALALTVDDVRLTSVTVGGSTFAAGSVVATGNADLSSFGGLAANDGIAGAWYLLLHDIDISNSVDLTVMTNARISGADTTWNLGVDGAYVTTASTVGDTVIRLLAPPTLGNTILDCNGLLGDHPDCAAALLDVAAFSTTGSGTTWTPTVAVYNDVGTIGSVDAGDTRIYHPTLAPGVVVGGDTDLGTTIFANAKVSILAADSPYALGDDVYWDADNSLTVTTSDIRLYHDWGGVAPSPGTVVACTAPTLNFDCAATLQSSAKIRVTGGDGTYTVGRSEYVYHSEDSFVNDEDFRFLAMGALPAATAVGTADADRLRAGVGSTDKLYLSWCEGAACPAQLLLQVGNIEFASGMPRVTDATSGYVPIASVAPGNFILHYPRQQVGILDDAFYVGFGTPGVSVSDVRLVPFDASNVAGTLVGSGSTQELGATTVTSATTVQAALRYLPGDAIAGYSAGDFVILDLPADINAAGTFGAYDQGDIRLTKTQVGTTTFGAGTIAKTGDTDVANLAFGAGNPAWSLAFHDADRDTLFSTGDVLYAVPGALPASGTLPLNSVRLTGTAAAGGGGGGGGGGGVPATPTTTLLNPTVTSTCAVASGSLTFSVTYRDTPDGRAPSTTNLVFNGVNVAMTGSGSAYSTGVVYSATVLAPANAGSFPSSFSFTNSGGTTTAAGPTIVVMSSTATGPTLANGMVTPASGEPGASFTWTVSYTDVNNDAPTAMNVVIDGVSHAMTSSDSTYCDGATYTYSQALSAGAHSYHFEFTAGGATARLPATGASTGPTVGDVPSTTSPGATDPGATSETTPTTKKGGTPAPGLAIVILAVLGLAVFMRRRD